MNKYLLLRDNKQSGPYTVNELASHGIKPYDLVWLEGRSAAWRYPSEMDELKAFSPAVEEQPFDRFYKKPEVKINEPLVKDNSGLKEPSSFVNEEIKKPVAKLTQDYVEGKNNSKKIHVSLPGLKAAEPVIINAIKEEVHSSAPSVLPSVEKLKMVTNPLPIDEPRTKTYIKRSTNIDSPIDFEENYKINKRKESGTDPLVTQAPVSKLLFRSVAAACLLLGGALIGLIINYNNQQKKFHQLNQLVEQIRQKDNSGTVLPVNTETSKEALTSKAGINDALTPIEEPVYKEDLKIPVTKIDRRVVKPVEKKSPTPAPVTQVSKVEAIPAVLKEEDPIPKTDKVSSELARKNLWQLVSIAHNTYKTGVFGGISNLSLKLSNKSLFQLEQVEVEVRFMGPEKKLVNKQTVIFENISPGEQLSVEVPKSSRGVKIDYTIKKINTKEFGLANAGM